MDDLIEPSARADNIIKTLTLLCSACIAIILLAILISLIQQSIPAMQKFGFGFIYSAEWNPPLNKFGALSAILGTLITSLIALIISIPLSYGIAISVTNILPKKLGKILSRLVELMSGIPSIIYGMWGLFVFGPFLMKYIEVETSVLVKFLQRILCREPIILGFALLKKIPNITAWDLIFRI